MKDLKLFEASIIGFFTGIVFSSYILFMSTFGRDIGFILNTVSLTNLIKYFPSQYTNSIVFVFLFYVLVYTVYVILFNFLFRINKKTGIILSLILIILIAGSIFQQVESFKKPMTLENFTMEMPNISNSNPEEITKYFGEEVKGDLNQDTLEDVAFLIKRNDGDERGDIYYLSSSLKNDQGYEGLNLLYVGEKITVKNLEIKDGIITLQYSEFDSDELKDYKVKVEENKLVEIIENEEEEQP
jgi:hypothetical protein